jgi:hypothetical protein
MKDLLEIEIPVEERQVDVVYILKDGTPVMQRNIQPYSNLFSWLDHKQVQHLISELKPQTDEHRKSIIVIFESGETRVYPNVSTNFTSYSLLKKASL